MIELKKFIFIALSVMMCFFALTGCAEKALPDLPENAIAFDMGTFEDREHDDALFGTIEYGGRTYLSYGTTNNRYHHGCIESCIGYIIQNEHSSSVVDPDNTSRRIYTLSGDPEHNFLMEFDASIPLMNQPDFFRAMDTKGKQTDIPDCIDSLGYEYWGES